jgi:hypothetical protein
VIAVTAEDGLVTLVIPNAVRNPYYRADGGNRDSSLRLSHNQGEASFGMTKPSRLVTTPQYFLGLGLINDVSTGSNSKRGSSASGAK